MGEFKKLKIQGKHNSDTKYSSTGYIPVYSSTDDLRGDKYINIQTDAGVGYLPLVSDSDTRFGSKLKINYKDGIDYRVRQLYEVLPSDIECVEFKLSYAGTLDGYTMGTYKITDSYVQAISSSYKKATQLQFDIYFKLKNGDYISPYSNSKFCSLLGDITITTTNSASWSGHGNGYAFLILGKECDYGYISGASFSRNETVTIQNNGSTGDDSLYYNGSLLLLSSTENYAVSTLRITSLKYKNTSVPFKFVDNTNLADLVANNDKEVWLNQGTEGGADYVSNIVMPRKNI